jgi:hypothetical protein
LFVTYLENVATKIKVFEPSGKQIREIAFPTIGQRAVFSVIGIVTKAFTPSARLRSRRPSIAMR